MLLPNNIEEKIGFDRIRDKLHSICKTSAGKDYVDNIRFSANIRLLISQLSQISEFQKARQSGENLPDSIHADAAEYLKSIMAAGTFLEPEQLLHIGTALNETEQWLKFLRKNQLVYPDLSSLTKDIDEHKEIQQDIFSAIDKNGEVKNSASPTLKKIRSELISQQVKARKSLDRLVAQAKAGGIIPDDASLTVRGGRLVVPVKAEFKRSFKGFIHDESSTGSIAYIEPAAVLELNNAIRDLEYQEKREVIRILTRITDHIRPEVHALHTGFDMLAKLDFIRAKAIFSDGIHAIPPQLHEELKLQWIRATHPILEETLRRQGKQIVPLDIELKSHQRILIISGPNAGGKSVCLKTVGLLQYMLQCGLHIPVAEGSSSTVFEDMLIDIGDEQSIENDLSTYSSHLKNMANFLHHGRKHSLFLIDEFGSGTDPQFGGAIAEAILETLYKKGMYGLVTTHYSNLKKMAEAYQDMANARMRFDVEKLEPLFRLETGKPGSSFSLEIAGKIGLPSGILKKARNHIGTDQIDMERLLNKLEIEKKFFEDKNRQIMLKQKLLDITLSNYDDLKKNLENQKKIILNEAKTEALNLLKVTNQKTENLIRRIRENRAEKESTKTLRKELKDFEKEIQPELLPEVSDKKIFIIKGNIMAGNQVRVKGQSAIGEVQSVRKNKALITFGELKTQISIDRLEKIGSKRPVAEPKTETITSSRIKGVNLNDKMASFSSELDLRGKRGEIARTEIIQFLDNAIMLGVPSARIIHGKGTGILRKIVREELDNRKEIKQISYEHADRGGDGVTIITF